MGRSAVGWLAVFFVACGGTGGTPEDRLTPAERVQLERERADKTDGAGLALYESSYLNLVLAGQTRDGTPFALATGRHGPHFPYFTDESQWDDLLLLASGKSYSAKGRALPGLELDFATSGSEQGTGRIVYRGPASDGAGRTVQIEIDLQVGFRRYAALQLGKRYNFLDLDAIPGLRWQPYALGQDPGEGDHIAVDGTRLEPVRSAGELEDGRLLNLRAPEFAAAYDYLCVAQADGDGLDGGYAHARFLARVLRAQGVLGHLIDAYLRSSGSATLTLTRRALTEGDPAGVRSPSAGDVLIVHTIDLGLADLDRQLVRTVDGTGRTLYGLNEIFHPK